MRACFVLQAEFSTGVIYEALLQTHFLFPLYQALKSFLQVSFVYLSSQ